MPPTSKTPPVGGGASRDCFGGRSQTLPTVQAYQVQFLTMAHAVRPEWAAMMAALAFGGGGQ